MTKKTYDPITSLIQESDSYTNIDQIEVYVENTGDLSPLPVQPVFLALKNLPVDKVAALLPRFSKEQREAFLDIDLWTKDEIDVENFTFWLDAYDLVTVDEVKKDFVTSEQFLLYLKSKFNVWTFDAEEPEYPEHDNYFLTDDNLLLFEFEEDYPHVEQVQALVKHLYYEVGVENAYSFLFKMVSDSFLTLQEDEYRMRKERLRDFGFVDYIDALEIENPFINIDFLNAYIKKKKVIPVSLDDISKNQNLHNSSLKAFKDHFKTVIDELLKVEDQERLDYLQFNFVRLINGRLESTNALKKGSVAMNRAGAETKNIVLLGFHYLKKQIGLDELVFSKFDFAELYKIGHSLLMFQLKTLKKALQINNFEGDKENFLGEYWISFLEESFDSPVKFKGPIAELEQYEEWCYQVKTVIDILPFAKKFNDTFNELKNEGRVQDSFYINYTIDAIDFEALLLSAFANHFLGSYDQHNINKMGLTIDEFKSFAEKVVSSEGKFVLTPELYQKIQNFITTFGLTNVSNIHNYLQTLLTNALEGYEFEFMSDDDFKHVGGPIILSVYKH